MATKKNEKEKEKKKGPGEKLILYELVDAYPEDNAIILGALAYSGYLAQYRHEESVYEKEEIKPSMTVDELTKIIKEFTGE